MGESEGRRVVHVAPMKNLMWKSEEGKEEYEEGEQEEEDEGEDYGE